MFVPSFSTARQSVFKFVKKSVIFVKKILIEFLYTILQKNVNMQKVENLSSTGVHPHLLSSCPLRSTS